MSDNFDETKPFPIEWNVPDDVPGGYSTNIVVQSNDHEFIINFFEIRPPIIFGSKEQTDAQIAQIDSIKATCIARITLAVSRVPELIRILNENMGAVQARVEESENEDD